MPVGDEQAKLLAAALFEIRLLLQTYQGDDVYVRLAERLAYALHNDALSILEGDSVFDVELSRKRIGIAEGLAGGTYPDGFGVLKSNAHSVKAPNN